MADKKTVTEKLIKALPVIMICVGAVMLAAMAAGDFLGRKKAERESTVYAEEMESLSDDEMDGKEKLLNAYNQSLDEADYALLDDVLGYVEIEKLDLKCAIGKGTGEEAMLKGVGHMENTSVPYHAPDDGGICAVLAGHSGLAGNEAFTRLDELEEGDLVRVFVLDEVLEYRVTGSEVVQPHEMPYKAEAGKNRLILITCAPRGRNTHRLLVHCELIK